ncbi:MAG: hypothetical protein AB2L13_04140 [Spirochaetota bacterium]
MENYDDRYIQSEEKFLGFTYDAYKTYFKDFNDFKEFYNKIGSKELKNKFLKLGGFYKFLILDGVFINENDDRYNKYIDYFDHTYKYIGIFSFIEDLYSDHDYVDFYDWLIGRKRIIKFPITNINELKNYHEEYLSFHGTTRKAYKFFNSLDEETKQLLMDKMEIRKHSATFMQIAKILIQLRNNFVHRAKLIAQFNPGPTVHLSDDRVIVNKLSFADVQKIFEKGFLIFFGYKAEKK